MATFVLVHGGGHGGWCYQFVARLLRADGHDVFCPTMTGLAERSHLMSPDINLESQINDIVQVLHYEGLEDVILVGHSYGGMVITGVADRCPERVGHRVYLDAAYPDDGQSLVDHAGPIILAAKAMGKVVDGIELVLFPGDDPLLFYGVTDPDLQAWMKPKLTPHPWACFEQKLHFQDEARMRAIPESHIICTSTIPGRDMERLKAASDDRIWQIDTGHDLMISEPEQTAQALREVAAAHQALSA